MPRAWKYADDVNTDEIIPARYLNTSDAEELASHCMEGADSGKFVAAHKPGDVIVAGRNFGCGSSREHAPLAIKTAGVSAVIAESFARIFFRNSINIGLPILESPGRRRGDLRPRRRHDREQGPHVHLRALPAGASRDCRGGGAVAVREGETGGVAPGAGPALRQAQDGAIVSLSSGGPA